MLLALAFAFALAPSSALAQVSLDLLAEELDLAPYVELLPEGDLPFAAVQSAPFSPNHAREVSFGFRSAPLWLRFRTQSARKVSWVLELGEPTLDHVQLLVVHEGGAPIERYDAGDALPFVDRALPYARISFALESPAHDHATYYLRVQSEDVLRVPLHAFTPRAFAARQQRVDGWMWAAYGILLMFAAYNFTVYWLVERTHYRAYGFLCLAFVLVLMTLAGHFAQWLVPTRPDLAARALPCSLALGAVCFVHFVATVLERTPELWNARRFRRLTWATVALLVFCTVAPIAIATRTIAVVMFCVASLGAILLWRLAELRLLGLRPFRKSWYVLVVTIPVAFLRYANVLPAWSPLLDWALPIGFVAHGMATSLALPAWAS